MSSTIPHFLYCPPLVVPHIGPGLEGLQGQIPMDHPIIKKGCAKLTTRVLHSEPESITKRWVLISQIHIAVVKSSSKKLATKHFSSFRSEESLAVWARKKCYGTTICFQLTQFEHFRMNKSGRIPHTQVSLVQLRNLEQFKSSHKLFFSGCFFCTKSLTCPPVQSVPVV